MLRRIMNAAGHLVRKTGKTIPPRRSLLILEALENRDLMAATLTAKLTPWGLLQIEGTARADSILVRQTANRISVSGVKIATPQGQVGSVDAGRVTEIAVRGLAGNDVIRLDQGTQPIRASALLDGGTGNDFLVGGAGADTFVVGNADADRIAGFRPNDQLRFTRPGEIVKHQVAGKRVYSLGRDGSLKVDGGRLAANVDDFAVTADGRVFQLSRGELKRLNAAGAWVTLAVGVNRIAVHGNTWYYRSGTSLAINGKFSRHVNDFAVDNQGTLYVLQGGDLLKQAPGSEPELLLSDVRRIAVHVGILYCQTGSGSWSYFPAVDYWQSPWSYLGECQDFAIDAGGRSYWLAAGVLRRGSNGLGGLQEIASGVTHMALQGNSLWYKQGDHVYVDGHMLNGVKDFAIESISGVRYRLLDNGDLIRDGLNGSSKLMNTGVSRLASLGTEVYYLKGTTLHYGGGGVLRSDTRDFAINPVTQTMYHLSTSGWLQSRTRGSLWHSIETAVIAFRLAPDYFHGSMTALNRESVAGSGVIIESGGGARLRFAGGEPDQIESVPVTTIGSGMDSNGGEPGFLCF